MFDQITPSSSSVYGLKVFSILTVVPKRGLEQCYNNISVFMSDEYKDRCIIITLLKTPPRYYSQYREHLESIYRTGRGGDLIKHN